MRKIPWTLLILVGAGFLFKDQIKNLIEKMKGKKKDENPLDV